MSAIRTVQTETRLLSEPAGPGDASEPVRTRQAFRDRIRRPTML